MDKPSSYLKKQNTQNKQTLNINTMVRSPTSLKHIQMCISAFVVITKCALIVLYTLSLCHSNSIIKIVETIKVILYIYHENNENLRLVRECCRAVRMKY